MSSGRTNITNEIFCSYAHEDLQYIEALRSHLRQLEREGIISCWYDGMIGVGQQWRREIEAHLNRANIILLFVSADFLNSDFCMQTELPIALARSNRKEALVVPVIVRPCDWETAPFAHLQALSTTPIAGQQGYDEAYKELAKRIRGFAYNQQIPPMGCLLLNLPLHRNRLFTGREEILQKLHNALESRKEATLIQAITGLGGIGKTQTVIEYAYRYQNHYTHIIWLNSESHEMIISDVTRLSREINTPGCYGNDQNTVVRGFLTWLETQHNWLLILDNVEDIALARTYMPKDNSQGHILLTTRRQAVGGTIEGIPLDAMDEKVGGTFLLKRTKKVAFASLSEQIPAEEMQLAMDLSNVLGGLPLALDQAGGYIERKQCSFERYLQIYEQAHEHLLAERGFPEGTTDYKYTVATTWSLSFQQVAQGRHGQAATDLLRICAFLAPIDIPVVMFNLDRAVSGAAIKLFGPDLGQVSIDAMQFEEVLEILLKYSLIRREGDVFFIHGLVQTVLRDAMTKEEHSLWAERTVQLMEVVFPDSQKVEAWPACQYLLPHMFTCVLWIERIDMRTETSASLLYKTGYYLAGRGFYSEAEPFYESALTIGRQVLGEEHPDTATVLESLGLLYHSQARYDKEEPLMREALVIRRKVLGEQHPKIALSLNNLAGIYTDQRRYEEAEPLVREALAIRQKELGEQHPETAQSLNSLAAIYINQRRYEEAEPLLKEALVINRKVLGEQHPNTSLFLQNLADLYVSQGQYAEAEPLLKQALAINREMLGEQHRDTATVLNNLAELYRTQGRYKEAEPAYQQSLKISRKILGEQHPETAAGLNNLGLLYTSQGRYKEAEPLIRQALMIKRKVSGEEHPETARSLNNLALLYFHQERYIEAEPLFKQSLEIRQKTLGEQHPATARVLNNLASLYFFQERYEEAELLYKEALPILISMLGEKHPETQMALSSYAALLSAREDKKKKKTRSTPRKKRKRKRRR